MEISSCFEFCKPSCIAVEALVFLVVSLWNVVLSTGDFFLFYSEYFASREMEIHLINTVILPSNSASNLVNGIFKLRFSVF